MCRYLSTAQPLVDSLFEGRNCLLFSYGPTNSGKTYTIEGDGANPGILPRVLDDVFTRSKDIEQKTPGTSIFIWATYLEVYNENVYDLLGANADSRIPMKIKEENGNVVVKGLREIQIRSLKEAQKILQYGQANRQTAETNVNLDSSRSHSIFNIRLVFHMQRALPNGGSETTELSPKFSVVDLAGSERSSRSQTTGLRLKEASNINVSLMTLGRCLEALKWNCDHPHAQPHIVPFRQSKLTRIFQQWFVAQSRMVMLVNVSAAAADYDEMVHALRYAHPHPQHQHRFSVLKFIAPPGTAPSPRTLSSAARCRAGTASPRQRLHRSSRTNRRKSATAATPRRSRTAVKWTWMKCCWRCSSCARSCTRRRRAAPRCEQKLMICIVHIMIS